jgi:protein involved in polysaccharide export with SLBB domain
VANDRIRVGDKITVQLSGVPDNGYFVEKPIPPTGEIYLPLLTQSFHAEGITTADLSAQIRSAYINQKIYTNPVITVLEEERFISVGGDVRSPSNVAYRSDSTLMSTINACGGFDEYAAKRNVRVVRGSQTLIFDCVKAATDPGADPPVYPGDQIFVPRTMFSAPGRPARVWSWLAEACGFDFSTHALAAGPGFRPVDRWCHDLLQSPGAE